MSLPISGFEEMSLNDTVVEDPTSVAEIAADNFLEGYEHPVAWFKKYCIRRGEIYEDVMTDNLTMKNVLLEEYYQNKQEWIKWELFGCTMVISNEYVSKGETDKALEVIGDFERILTSIGSDDLFLNSIKTAIDHITFSFKGYLLKLCSLETSVLLESFDMPHEMDRVNKSALYGAQSLFFYEYGILCTELAKDNARKAISLNEREAEWHFLLSKVFSHWQLEYRNFSLVTKEEFDEAKKAVELGKSDQYKLNLAFKYQKMSRYSSTNAEKKKHFVNMGFQLVKEILKNDTNDFLTLKHCLRCLLKLFRWEYSDEINDMLKKLVDRLKSSDNPHVHAGIGNYYLFRIKDYEKANFYLKKPYEIKSFGNSLDYAYTFYKIDPNTTRVEPLFVEMLKTFPNPFQSTVILCLLITYLIVVKNDLIKALKYIPQLLDIKNVDCVHHVQQHRVKFTTSEKPAYFIDMLSEKLNETLSDHTEKVTEVVQMFESYKEFVSRKCNKFKNDVLAKDSKSFYPNYNNNVSWGYKNPKQDSKFANSNEKENWRSLKPDSTKNHNIFSRKPHS